MSLRHTLDEFASDRLAPIAFPRLYLTSQMLRREQGSLVSNSGTTIPGGYPHMSSDVVRDASLALKQAKNTSVTLKMRSIPGIERRMVALTDSSMDTSGNERHRKGILLVQRIPAKIMEKKHPYPRCYGGLESTRVKSVLRCNVKRLLCVTVVRRRHLS